MGIGSSFKVFRFIFLLKGAMALVGANGAGKTTFLKIISGSLEPSRGNVQIPKEARVGILDQDYYRFGTESILDVVMMGDTELWKVLKKKEVLLGKEKLTDRETEEISEIESKLSMQGGYRAEAKAAQLLSGLGIETKRHGMPLDTLSGGYKLRVSSCSSSLCPTRNPFA